MLRILWAFMPSGLHRTYGAHHLHFITNSCYQRRPLLGTARARDRVLSVFEQTRQRYRFVVVGCVVILGECPYPASSRTPAFLPAGGGISRAQYCCVWVGTGRESGRKRGLVRSPEQWRWSSYRHYLLGETGPVKVNVDWGEISFRDRVA